MIRPDIERQRVDPVRLFQKDNKRKIYLRLFLKKGPDMLSSSQRTTTTFCPFRICLATMEARRPRRWPFPSMTTTCITNVSDKVVRILSFEFCRLCRGISAIVVKSQLSLCICPFGSKEESDRSIALFSKRLCFPYSSTRVVAVLRKSTLTPTSSGYPLPQSFQFTHISKNSHTQLHPPKQSKVSTPFPPLCAHSTTTTTRDKDAQQRTTRLSPNLHAPFRKSSKYIWMVGYKRWNS